MGNRIPGIGKPRADYLDLRTVKAPPERPPAGITRVYRKTDKRIYSMDEAGVESGPFSSGGGGSGYIAAITAETGITAYWPLNEGAGTTYADAIGTNDLTALATTPGFCSTLTKDAAGGSLHIPSASFRVGRAALTWGSSYTYEGWVIPALLTQGFVFGQWNGAGSMVFHTGSAVQCYSGGSFISFAPTAAEMTGRHHVSWTHDGTNLRLYWDGVLKAGPTTLTIPGTNVGGAVRVGSYSDTTGNGSALYSDIAFYSGRVLTAGELLAHYNLGA